MNEDELIDSGAIDDGLLLDEDLEDDTEDDEDIASFGFHEEEPETDF